MKLFNFANKFIGSSQQDTSYLSLVLAPDRVLALIWQFTQDTPDFLGYGQKIFQNPQLLLHEAAVAIDTAGEKAQVDVKKTVFGLSEDWQDEGDLSKNSPKTLKKLADELELTAQAYVSLAVSINHLLKFQEGVTPQVLALGIFGDSTRDTSCEIHLLQNNQVAATKTTQLLINVEKISSLLSQLKSPDRPLPSRLLIYGLDQNSDLASKISKYNWQDLFIQEPKIEFLDNQKLVQAVAYAQAADLLGHEPTQTIRKTPLTKTTESAADQLGFVEGEDILEIKKQKTPPPPPPDQQYAVEVSSAPINKKTPIQVEETAVSEPSANISFFAKIFSYILTPPSPKKLMIGLGLFIAIVLIASFIASQILISSQLIIKINAQEYQSDFNINVVPQGSYDTAKSQIPGQSIIGRAQASQKAVAGGSKKTGDPAQGEVTIFNITSAPKAFPKGTTIINKSGLKFSLDEAVEATSAGKPGQPGQTKARVTALEVGPQYNLDPGQDLSFTEFDEFSYWVQNDAPFTGGAQRQVTVVTQDDLERLEKLLMDTTVARARDDLKSQAAGQKLIDEAIIVKVINKDFDKKPEEEAALVNLDLAVEAQAIVFDENDLKKLLVETKETPANLQIHPQDIEINQLKVSPGENQLTLAGRFRASLIPKFSQDELKGKIKGQSQKEARAIIREIPEVTDITINFSPQLPIFNSLPRNEQKIIIKIETN